MQRCHQENTPAFTILLLGIFKIGYLKNDGYSFKQEDAAQDGDEQFFPNSKRQYCDHSSECKTACITHKDLSRVRVVPQKSEACTNKCSTKDHLLSEVGDVHYVEVATKIYAA